MADVPPIAAEDEHRDRSGDPRKRFRFVKTKTLTDQVLHHRGARRRHRQSGKGNGTLAAVPAAVAKNVRNDRPDVETIRNLEKQRHVRRRHPAESRCVQGQHRSGDQVHPPVVKVAVASAGTGPMVGWSASFAPSVSASARRISPIAGRIGRAGRDGHDWRRRAFGLPVSTTHVLSSGVAGTMAANVRACNGHDSQPADGLGADASDRNPAVGQPLLAVPKLF